MIDVCAIRQRFEAVSPFLDERGRRLVAAAEAVSAGYGGIAAVATATGVAPSTIGRGLKELSVGEDLLAGRIRRLGGGRKPRVAKDSTLISDLEALVEPTTRGDPESPLRWTCKSLRRLAVALRRTHSAPAHSSRPRAPSTPRRLRRPAHPRRTQTKTGKPMSQVIFLVVHGSFQFVRFALGGGRVKWKTRERFFE